MHGAGARPLEEPAGYLGGQLTAADETALVAAKPMLPFTTEGKSHRVEPVRDGVFAPPQSTQRVNRK